MLFPPFPPSDVSDGQKGGGDCSLICAPDMPNFPAKLHNVPPDFSEFSDRVSLREISHSFHMDGLMFVLNYIPQLLCGLG